MAKACHRSPAGPNRSYAREIVRVVTNVEFTSPTGGIELNVLQISRALADHGHEVHLLFERPGSLLPEYRGFCASVTHVEELDYRFPIGCRARLLRRAQLIPAVVQAARRRPEVCYGNRAFATGWAVPAGKLTGAPVVIHEHGWHHLAWEQVLAVGGQVDRWVMVSQFVANAWLEAGLDPDRVSVVHNGIAPSDYPVGGLEERSAAREELGLPDDPFVVAFVGRLDREKGIHVLLEAWRRLGWTQDEGRLLVVGSALTDPDRAAYEAEIRALADEHVVFLPARRDVVTPLHAADVVVVPSIVEEAFGRSVVEALATGRPVVASRVGGIPEILTGSLEDLLVPPNDPVELAARLASLRDWRHRDVGLAERCTARVEEAFTLDRTVDGVEAAFRSVR